MVFLIPVLGLNFFRDHRAPTIDTRRFVPDFLKIRCPRCYWRPHKSDRWLCSPGCQHCWNTFDTAGICPGCSKHWSSTACLNCHQWSPHEDWYEQTPTDD